MEQIKTEIEISKNLQQVFSSASNYFDKIELPEDYKQSFVFRCLNVLKGREKEKFIWEVIRLLNSKSKKLEAAETKSLNNLIFSLKTAAITLDDEIFFKHAYAFLLGIMKKPY